MSALQDKGSQASMAQSWGLWYYLLCRGGQFLFSSNTEGLQHIIKVRNVCTFKASYSALKVECFSVACVCSMATDANRKCWKALSLLPMISTCVKQKDRSNWIIGSRLTAVCTGCSFSLLILYFLFYVSGYFKCHFCSYLTSFKYLAYVASSWKLAALKPNKLQNKLLYANIQ